jgi:hypothetical protein
MNTIKCVIDYVPDTIAGNYWVKIGRNLETKPVIIVEQFEDLDAALDWIGETYPLEIARWLEDQRQESH